MMMKFDKMILVSASVLFIPICTGCRNTMEEAMVSGITNSVSGIVSSIITNIVEAALGI